MLDNILPVRGVIMAAQVRLQLATENLQGGTFADTIGSHETEDLARSRRGQTVKFEAVGAIAVRDLVLEVRRQVDNGDSIKRALLRADAATDTQRL